MRLFSAALVCGICLGPAAESPATAQWFAKKPSQPSSAPVAAHQGFAGYIRRLTADARAAAARGDAALARSLAERAHKLAITGKPMLANEPDCSPEATAALVQQLKAMPDPAASPAIAAQKLVAQKTAKEPIDLAPLIDAGSQETNLPLPPSPAPEITPPQRRTSVAAMPVAKPAVRAADQSATQKAVPADLRSSRITSLVETQRQRVAKSTRSQDTAGFLSLQSDWLSSDTAADDAIEELAKRPAPTQSKKSRPRSSESSELSSSRRRASSAGPTRLAPTDKLPEQSSTSEDEAGEPEVTTAIGRDVNRWQLDVEHEANEFNKESVPQLSQDVAARQELGTVDSPETALGIWSAAASREGASAGKRVVSLSDFLDPNGNRPAAGQIGEAPRMIETDFRQPETTPTADNRSQLGHASRSNQASPIASHGPAIEVHDGPALEWLDSSATSENKSPSMASAVTVDLDWSRWSPGRKAAVIGMSLLIAGFALFGLSFRWS